MMNQFPSTQTFLLACLFICTTTTILAQTPAQPPAPPGPTNISKILEKAGQFTTILRLMSITQVSDQINTQLNNSNQGLTVFAPTDNAFSGLKAGTLNSLSDQQKVQLVQYHVVPTFLATSQFQTVSNPLRTQAGNNNGGQFPLNITTSGNQVNISTGIVDTTVSNTIYTDGSLAVYQVDKVLQPLGIFAPQAPAPAPLKSKGKKKPTVADGPSSDDSDSSTDTSAAYGLRGIVHEFMVGSMVALVAWFCL